MRIKVARAGGFDAAVEESRKDKLPSVVLSQEAAEAIRRNTAPSVAPVLDRGIARGIADSLRVNPPTPTPEQAQSILAGMRDRSSQPRPVNPEGAEASILRRAMRDDPRVAASVVTAREDNSTRLKLGEQQIASQEKMQDKGLQSQSLLTDAELRARERISQGQNDTQRAISAEGNTVRTDIAAADRAATVAQQEADRAQRGELTGKELEQRQAEMQSREKIAQADVAAQQYSAYMKNALSSVNDKDILSEISRYAQPKDKLPTDLKPLEALNYKMLTEKGKTEEAAAMLKQQWREDDKRNYDILVEEAQRRGLIKPDGQQPLKQKTPVQGAPSAEQAQKILRGWRSRM